MQVRLDKQFSTATRLAQWLSTLAQDPNSIVTRVWHGSLQANASELIGPGKQMSCGSACFLIQLEKPVHAQHLGFNLDLFTVSLSLSAHILDEAHRPSH